MAADNSSEMECPSPDVGDSRKRPLDTDIDSNLIKRSHFSGGKKKYLTFQHEKFNVNNAYIIFI